MTKPPAETIEQMKARLKREDEEKEEAWQRRRDELKARADRYRAEKDAEKEKEERAKRQAVEKGREERQRAEERRMKESALASWLAGGGSEAEFEEAWPSLRTGFKTWPTPAMGLNEL